MLEWEDLYLIGDVHLFQTCPNYARQLGPNCHAGTASRSQDELSHPHDSFEKVRVREALIFSEPWSLVELLVAAASIIIAANLP